MEVCSGGGMESWWDGEMVGWWDVLVEVCSGGGMWR